MRRRGAECRVCPIEATLVTAPFIETSSYCIETASFHQARIQDDAAPGDDSAVFALAARRDTAAAAQAGGVRDGAVGS